MANNEILLKSASGQLIGAFSANFYDVNGNKLTYRPALGDDGWTTWTLSGDLYRLGEYCIYNTDAEKIILPDSLTVIDGNAIRENNSLTTLTIPDSVTTVNSWAVMNCSELTTLFIGSGIQTIGANGFRGLGKLNSITITATTPPATSNYSFCEVAYSGTLYAPNDSYQAWVDDIYLLDGWTLNTEGGDVPEEPTPEEPIPDELKEYLTKVNTNLLGDVILGKKAGRLVIKKNNGEGTVTTNDTTLTTYWDASTGSLIIEFPEVVEDKESWVTIEDVASVQIYRRNLPFTNNVCLPENVEYIRTSDSFARTLIFRGDVTGSTVKIKNNDWTTPAFGAYTKYEDGTEEYTYEVSLLISGIYGKGQYRVNHQGLETVFDVIIPRFSAFLDIVSITGNAYEQFYKYYIPEAVSETDKSVITFQAVDMPDLVGETTSMASVYLPTFELYSNMHTRDFDGWNYWRNNADAMTAKVVNGNLQLTIYDDKIKKSFATPIFLDDGLTTVQPNTGHPTIQVMPFVKEGTENILTVNIPSEIAEETDVPISIVYSTGFLGDAYLTFETPDDVIITIDTETEGEDGLITATGTIRVNAENTSSQIDVKVTAYTIDYRGTSSISQTKTITILDKEPPMAAPTISINKYADLAFPQEGGTKYITITYENTSLAYINQPVSAADIQIKAETTTETDTGVQIYYSITVPSTTMKREIPLTFSCLSPSGLSCTETYYAMQEGQTETDDYCWINAFPVHLTFEATGGTQRIQVRAGYPDVDKPITAKVRNSKIPSINISWCTANFVSREYSDDYTEVTEQWDIVMSDHSHITEPFMADITFSYTNSYGDSASYGCTATVKGGDGEEQASEIEAYRTVMRFDANGVFDYSDATCTVAYHWIDEVDIEDPVVSADWIVVTEGTHKSTAGKIEIPWHIAVGKNTSPNERTGTVTFSAIGMNDEELSVTMTVMQGGADVKDETLEYVDLLWKDCEVELGDDDMTFEILDESYDVFYTGRCQKRPLGEKNTFLINKIVQDYVWMEEIPALLNGTAEYQEHVNGYRKFRLDTPDTVGAMRSFYFKYDWSYQEGSPFVLSESIIPYVVEGQKNLITYCNLDYNNPRTDIYTWIKSNGSVENGAISAENEEYATKVITMPENADYYVLGGQRYEVLSPCRAKYVLYYLSPKGGWCWFPIMGKVKSSDRLTAYTLSSNYNNTTTQFGKKRYTVDIATDYDLSTGWLTESQSLRMWEMLESNMVYLHDMEKDVIFPVLMRQDTVEKKNVNRGERKMISYTFGVETSQGKMRI